MISRYRLQTGSPYAQARPAYRGLRIFSIDPSLERTLESYHINTTIVNIPWEVSPNVPGKDGPDPGPVGEYLEVIDYDPVTGKYFKPVDLNDPYLLAENGLTPSDGNPQFHQQMVYAVAMRTIRNFEVAQGRRALWSPRRWKDSAGYHVDYVPRLRIYPHALREPNAYYSPLKKSLLFGYFRATPSDVTQHLPGATVFTCLSHDVVAHETAHALLDGMHRRFTESSNPDVLAFHEAFADIVALFQHFSLPQVVEYEIARTRGDLGTENMLANLAQEFGRAIGRNKALRSAIGIKPDPQALEDTIEPHQRGSILVAAVFDAFLAIYRKRIADLLRIATQGSGILPQGQLHPDLIARLAREAEKTAQHVLTMCIRTLDYLPPVDVTFGDFLRALITADYDMVTDDKFAYRVAFMESFRHRGIYPRRIRSFSQEGLRWEGPDLTAGYSEPEIFLGKDLKENMQNWNLSEDREAIFNDMRSLRAIAHSIIERTRDYKSQILTGIDFNLPKFEVHSIRPVRRAGSDGELQMNVVVEITQRVPGYINKPFDLFATVLDDQEPDFWFRGGCTLIIDLDTGKLRYCIYKRINNDGRYERQRSFLSGQFASDSLQATYFDPIGLEEREEIFSFMHRFDIEGE